MSSTFRGRAHAALAARAGSPARLAALVVAGVVVAGGVGWLAWLAIAYLQGQAGANAPAAETESPPGDEGLITLTSAKADAAGVRVAPVEQRELRAARTVSGRIGYDESNYLSLLAPVAGVVESVAAEPGARLKAGDPLVVLASPEIGLARDEVALQEANLRIARQSAEWADAVADNLNDLLAALADEPAVDAVEQQFESRTLGDHRERILAAYSARLLAEQVNAESASLADQGVLAGRLLQERRSRREVAAAQFVAACEQARFDASQHRERTRADVDHAIRMLEVGQSRLRSLLGPYADTAEANADASRVTLRAPFDSIVQERFAVASSRVAADEPLFTLADTSRVWVSAQLFENDWSDVATSDVEQVRVRVPALPDQQFTARVRFVGSRVAAESRSVRLVAELDNEQGLLKPGLFAWIEIPVGAPRSALAVPPAAVLRHEQQPFVFVEVAPRTFRHVHVALGLETPQWVEIADGLEAGQPVVVDGAFFLKSEMLLAGEAE